MKNEEIRLIAKKNEIISKMSELKNLSECDIIKVNQIISDFDKELNELKNKIYGKEQQEQEK
jgi:hypothetical protein